MNIAEFCIKNKVITWIFTIVVLFGGLRSYNNLSRLEDPEFTIKIATVITPYPGASAREVEKEVSDVLEQAVQQMGQVDYVESRSTRGLSIIRVSIKDKYDKFTLPQVWDELRRKINDARGKLPPGAGEPLVNDDFGDVYGEFYALTGKGYSTKDLVDTAEMMKRDLLSAQDVKKIVLYGDRPEVIYIEMRREKMAELGVSRDDIYKALQDKNLPADSGHITLGQEYIPLNPTGEYKSEKEFGELLVNSHGSERFIKLKDVAEVKRGYKDPPFTIMRYDGEPAIGLGVSTVLGGNVIKMGDSLNIKLKELNRQIPVGMSLNPISQQSDTAKKAVRGFVVNLLEAVAIVVLVLLFSMGLRSGLIIGAVLFLTICGTFIFMDIWKVTLERISLGALIIALGMLVDNAIVITDGMKVKMLSGKKALEAANDIVGQTAMPLLGATVVAVTAFAAIGTSQDSTGEYCRSLFQVILMSLMFSWVTAVTVTPLFCEMFLLGKKDKERAASSAAGDPYGGMFYAAYKKFLQLSIKYRWRTVAAMLILFVLAVYGFGFTSKSFFPPSTRPQYFVNFRMAKGTSINATDEAVKKAEKYLMSRPETAHITTMVGGSQIRFLLTYPSELSDRGYGQIVVNVKDAASIGEIEGEVKKDLEELLPGVIVEFKKFMLGPGDGGKIQLRISGPDHDQLRALADKVKEAFVNDGNATNVRDDWGSRVKVIRPQVEDAQANKLGVSRSDIAAALLEGYDGKKIGVYRENNKLLDICARPPETERRTVDNLYDLGIWSPVEEKTIFIRQVVSGFPTVFEDDTIWRRDRRPTVTIHADQIKGESSALFARIKPDIEKTVGADFGAISGTNIREKDVTGETVKIYYKNRFPISGMPGYSFGWDGEAEDSAKANASLGKSLPVFLLMMVVIVFCLFNAVRMPLVIWLTVPFAIIGVTSGLLLFNQPFSFMALLGFLSLSGMIIKTAIVLADEINAQIASGKGALEAVIGSGMSRLNPVFNAAATTMLGMLPLFQDIFFVPMAVTIVFGLGFATVLVLVAVPVFYAILFKVPYKDM